MAIMKVYPEDFVVREIHNTLTPQNKGNYSYFVLFKRSYNTLKACQKIASTLNIALKEIGFSGNKDKNALTFQVISIPTKLVKKDFKIIEEDLKVTFLGYFDNPIKLGMHKENSFEIRIRNCPGNVFFNKKKFYVPNYFDEQRFSTHNVVIGKSIINKQFKKALEYYIISNISQTQEKLKNSSIDEIVKYFEKNKENNDIKHIFSKELIKILTALEKNPNDIIGALRKIPLTKLTLIVNSYQSYLYNEILSKVITHFFEERFDLKISKYLFSSIISEKELDNYDIPLIGFSTSLEYKKGFVNDFMLEVLSEEKLTFRDFIIREFPILTKSGSKRKAFFLVKDFKVEDEGKNTKKYSFTIPKGCYATTVIKTIFASFGIELSTNKENEDFDEYD